MVEADRLWRRLWARRWLRRSVIGVGISIAVVAIAGFFVVPPIARHVAQKQLSELLGRKVAIAKIRLNPFALSLAVEGFQIYEADGVTPFLGFGRLYVNAQLSSAFRRAPVIKEVALESPRVRIVRVKATRDAWADVGAAYNFSDIVARLEAMPKSPEPPEPPDAAPPRFSLNNLHLAGGAVIFDDQVAGDHHEITELSIGVPFASTLPVYLDSFVEPGLSVRVDGTPFVVGGRTKPFKDSLETSLELRLTALDLTRYLPFVPVALPFSVESARLSLALDLGFVRPRADAPTLTVKGRVALDALDVREKRKSGPAPLCKLGTLEILIGESDLTGQRFMIDKVLVSGLDLHVRRQGDGTLNLEHLAPADASDGKPAPKPKPSAALKPKPPGAAGAGPQFALARFTLDKSVVHFRDETTSPAFITDVRDIGVSVEGLSNARGATAKTAIGLRAVPGGTVTQNGTVRLTPLQAAGSLAVEGIEPARFAPYTQGLVAFDVLSGRVRLGGDYLFEQAGPSPKIQLKGGFVEIAELALRRRGARDDFFKLGALAVKGAAVDVGARTVTVAEVTTRDGRVRAARDAKGVIDLTTLAATAPATPEAATSRPTPPPVAAPAAESGSGWTVALSKFALDRWGARFDDKGVTPAAVITVDPISIHANDVSTARGAKLGFDLKLGINKKGRLQASGSSVLDPLAADVRFDLRGLEIVPLQPYFRDQVSLVVTGGAVSVKGRAAMKPGVGANADPRLNVALDLDVDDLATVDAARREPLIGWKSFHVGGVKFTSPPVALAVDEVALNDFHTRLVMSADERINLADAFVAPGAAPAPAKPAAGKPTLAKAAPAKSAPAKPASAKPPAADAPKITIARVLLKGGNVSFNDRAIKPSYTVELTDLAARISGLSSVPGTTADIELSGAVNRSGALAVGGKINPLADDLFADVQVSVRGFELPPTSPYSGKFVGLAIGKGKLDLALDYKIAARKLEAKNKLVLDQFTFGDKVESPDALKLPVRLAVSLLKDRKGVIDIDLPIAGSLDDPDFKIGRAVLKVLGNLVVKAVTAPFSLIASAFGGGDELSRIDFAPGTAALDAIANKRVATLAKALQERPGISFEIEGGAQPGQDREGVRRESYERKLKTAKMAAMVEGGAAVASVDALVVTPAERGELIGKVYEGEKFQKPKNAIGLEKSLPPSEMEKLILANTKVEDDDLRALALRRATAVQAALGKAAPGAGGRLFLLGPRLGTAGRHVELKLRKD